MLLLMKNHHPSLFKCVGTFVLGLLHSTASMSNAQEDGGIFTSDLRVLTAVIPEYIVDQVTIKEATEKLIALVLGEDANKSGLAIVMPETGGASNLTLELKDTSAQEILVYISELAGASYEIKWNGGNAPILVWRWVSDCESTREYNGSTAFRCPRESAHALGIRSEMTPEEVAAAISKYGVEFDQGAAVIWNPKTEMMAVRNTPSQRAFIQSLVKVIDKGWSLAKTESKQKS
ncbi:hypothetical protein BH11VER1_BH11VER1_23870 [soil metagenome]